MKKIIYFVGAYGCGKTHKVSQMEAKYKDKAFYLYEDDAMLFFLKNQDKYIRQQFYLYTMYYRLEKLFQALNKHDVNLGFVDGHPLLNLVYGRTFFEVDNGHTFNFHELSQVSKAHSRMHQYVRKKWYFTTNIKHHLVYINLPLEENLENILERKREGFILNREIDPDYLLAVRRILNSEIFHLKDFYHSTLHELKSRNELDSFNPEDL